MDRQNEKLNGALSIGIHIRKNDQTFKRYHLTFRCFNASVEKFRGDDIEAIKLIEGMVDGILHSIMPVDWHKQGDNNWDFVINDNVYMKAELLHYDDEKQEEELNCMEGKINE